MEIKGGEFENHIYQSFGKTSIRNIRRDRCGWKMESYEKCSPEDNRRDMQLYKKSSKTQRFGGGMLR
jgi:hypothetical protein